MVNHWKRSVSTLVLVGVAGMAVASSGAAKTNIKFLGNWYNVPDQVEIFKRFVKDFNDSQSDIKVTLIQGGSEDKLKAMMAAGTAPDVVHFDRYLVATYARDGLFAPLDKYLPPAMNVRNEFLPATVQEALWEGKLFALPMDTDIRGLFWNKKLLEEAGLDSTRGPQTWEQLSEFSRKLTRKGANGKFQQVGFIPWGGNWYINGWIWTFGGDYYDYKTGKPAFASPENTKALAWLESWAKTQYAPSILNSSGFSGNTHLVFAKNKIGMEAAHYGALPGWYQITNPNIQVWGGPVPHPAGGKNGTWSGGMCLVMPAGSRYKGAAGKFMAWMLRPENQKKFYSEIRQLPPTYKGLEATKDLVGPLEKVFVNQLPVSRGRAPFSNVLLNYLGQAQDDVINLRKSPETALAQAQDSALKKHPSLWKKKVPIFNGKK